MLSFFFFPGSSGSCMANWEHCVLLGVKYFISCIYFSVRSISSIWQSKHVCYAANHERFLKEAEKVDLRKNH